MPELISGENSDKGFSNVKSNYLRFTLKPQGPIPAMGEKINGESIIEETVLPVMSEYFCKRSTPSLC